MLEANTFRMMMLIGAIIVIGLFVAVFFTVPVVHVDVDAKDHYERVMLVELGDRQYVTGYEALQFSIQGNARGTIRHY